MIYFSLEITEMKISKGLALQDVLTEVHAFVHRSNVKIFTSIYYKRKRYVILF